MLVEVHLKSGLLPSSKFMVLDDYELIRIIVVKYINVLLILYSRVRATELYNPLYDFICMLFCYTLKVN